MDRSYRSGAAESRAASDSGKNDAQPDRNIAELTVELCSRHPGDPSPSPWYARRVTRRSQPHDAPPHTGVRVSTRDVDGVELVFLDVPEPSRRGAVLDALTTAEREVAELVLDGCSNAEVADRRGTSARTVANQLAQIYRTLEVSSRAELCALLSERSSWPEDA